LAESSGAKWSRLNFTKWQLGAASGGCWSADG
jgi:hypothetical protein